MKKPKFWLDFGLTGAKCINMEERPDLMESLMLFGNEFQPIGWPSQDVKREDGLTIPTWITNACEYFDVNDNDPEVRTFIQKMVHIGLHNVEVLEVQWDEESVLVLKY